MLAGTAGRQWAISSLGRFFTLEVHVADDQTVVEHGPCRLVRHPGYAASLLTFTGMGLVLGNWLSLLVVVGLPLVGYLRRIQVEERALTIELGEAYVRYAATHRRLIPGLW
jgi:protein-S-isoprenylcysteine O-methyltransferase Ste14